MRNAHGEGDGEGGSAGWTGRIGLGRHIGGVYPNVPFSASPPDMPVRTDDETIGQ